MDRRPRPVLGPNDPHRAVTNPSLRYIVHLNAPGWNVIGAIAPWRPGVAEGHNQRIAWNLDIDVFEVVFTRAVHHELLAVAWPAADNFTLDNYRQAMSLNAVRSASTTNWP